LFEAALMLPVLIFMIGALVVMSTRLSDNMFLAQSSRELALKLSRTNWLAQMGTGAHQFHINMNEPEVPSPSQAEYCLQNFADFNQYSPCGYADCDPCADIIIRWYVYKLFESKLLFIDWDNHPLDLEVSFGPPAEDPEGSDGLCFITVSMNAIHKGWLLGLDGELHTNARAPYVSNPVPNAGNGCDLYHP
jgi:hypothetical protein